MRNWNSNLLIISSRVILCFEPTYEELKLGMNARKHNKMTRFEPTYEELKLPSALQPGKSSICFEPTYEELKLSNLIYLSHTFFLFWAYLWGIETIYHIQAIWNEF